MQVLYRGGERAGKGTYWSLKNGVRVEMATEGVLPGGEASRFMKAPPVLMFPLAGLLGVIYLAALPAISVALLAWMAVGKALGGLLALSGRGLSFGWRPATAYLAGRKRGKGRKGGGGEA
jgi:hypothetical protein